MSGSQTAKVGEMDKFDRIVASLHEAALDDAHWPRTTALIDDACDLDATHLAVINGGVGAPDFLFSVVYHRGKLCDEPDREYIRDYAAIDERVPRLLHLPHGCLLHNRDLFTARELKTSATFNDFLRRYDSQNQLAVRLDGPDGLHIMWVVTRQSRPGEWGAEHFDSMRRLLPHLRHAVRVRQALAQAEARDASVARLLEHALIGVAFLDRDGAVVEANACARDILRRGDGLSDAGGRISACLASDNAKLGRLLARVLPRLQRQAVGGSMTVERAAHLLPYTLHLHPVAVLQADFGARRVAALALIVDPQVRPRVHPHRVAATLDVTPAQSRVAAALAAGHTVREIAAASGCAEATVRWHLKQLFARTGCAKQADLVRLVLTVAGAE